MAIAAGPVAAEPLMPDRPGQTDPPTVVGRGIFQVEGGFRLERETGGDDPDTDTFMLPEVLFRLGVHPRLEVRIAADGYVRKDEADSPARSNGSDLLLQSKWRISDQRGFLPVFTLLGGLSLPTGSDGVTSDGVDPSLALLFANEVGESFVIIWNLAFSGPTQGVDDSRRIFQFEPKIALERPVTERLGAFVEYFGAIETGGGDDEHSLGGGFFWSLTDDVQLDLSAGFGANSAAPDWFVAGGLIWRFQLF